jgi:3-oxoacyl-[acyl-carrier-protein] synthase II
VKRRVVITGIGMLSPVGNDTASTWRGLLDGVSGAGPITQFDTTNFPVKFGCELKGFDPLMYMDRKEVKRNDVFTQMALAASVQAITDAGLGEGGYDPENTGVIIGSGIGGLKVFEAQHDVYRERGPGKISPFFIPMFIPDMAAGVVSSGSTPRDRTTRPSRHAPRPRTRSATPSARSSTATPTS